MSTTLPTFLTAEQFLALPDDGVERQLIRGQVREVGMTIRNRWHSRTEANLVGVLKDWLRGQPAPRGAVYSGEVGCLLRRAPDSLVGIDVAYFAAATLAQQPADTTLMVGPPLLAIEVLSPSDRQEEINDKVDEYLLAGVVLVWLVDPHFRTVRVHQPEAEPALYNVRQSLTAEPVLPGFQTPVAAIFE